MTAHPDGPGEHLDPGDRSAGGEQHPDEHRFVGELAEPPAPETDPDPTGARG
ncbi:hypothetical protein [Amycolatopsis anabasis]|uniref:hypothetical protein n=1 Tax=Amycolatopsis anabasis TaxID=1840409 RepID=UPI00131C94C4|nr:hypothetical protein [Amycolatopsis anabasis]